MSIKNVVYNPVAKEITITLSVAEPGTKSGTGKSFTVATTGSPKAAMIPNLGPVKIGVNVFSEWNVLDPKLSDALASLSK